MDVHKIHLSDIFFIIAVSTPCCIEAAPYNCRPWAATPCDPCKEENHWILDDRSRSVNFYDSDLPLLTDDSLALGWYRSLIPGAEDIAFHRPQEKHCQTSHPLWLDGEVDSYDRSQYHLNEGYFAYVELSPYITIYIYQCIEFNVYQLKPAHTRYCFGGAPPQCQNDDTCPDYYQMFNHDKHPQITLHTMEQELPANECQQQIIFSCDIDLGNVTYDVHVTWSVNNTLISEEILVYSNLPATLTDVQMEENGINYFGYLLTCRVKIIYENGTLGQAYVTDFYVGFTLVTSTIYLNEGGNPSNYEVVSTVPLPCIYPCDQGQNYTCNQEIPIHVTSESLKEIALQSVNQGNESCLTTAWLHSTPNQLPKLSLPLYPRQDGLYDGTQMISFEISISSGVTFPLQSLSCLALPTSEVYIHDVDKTIAGKSCTFYNDPHACTFDNVCYEAHKSGIFTIYKHRSSPIEVQAYFRDYWEYSGVCGLAVRSANETFVVNFCTSTGLVIYLSTDTKIETTLGRIIIYPSVSDISSTEGLCGTLNNNKDDDFKYKNTDQSEQIMKYPYRFMESWRVPADENIFYGNIKERELERETDKNKFCECDDNGRHTCKTQASAANVIRFGKAITETGERTNYTDNIEDDSELEFAYDPDFVAQIPEWRNGWTEQSARTFCSDFLLTRPSVSFCKDLGVVNWDGSLESCFDDIHITGTTNSTVVQLDMIISQCREELQKNYSLVQNQTTGNNGSHVNMMDQLLSNVCISDCSDHGICSNGECVCDAGYSGIDCSAETDHVPVLYPLPQGGLCDISTRPCQTTPVHADMFIETDNLTCQVQILDMQNLLITGKNQHLAELEHYQKVFCQIPAGILPYIVRVSVSNNGIDFSQPQELIVFHSVCWHCSWETLCQKKIDSCLINAECFGDGVPHPSDASLYCHPDTDQYGWTMYGDETTQAADETSLSAEETTQIGEETTLIGEETTQIGEETTQIGEETTLIGEETTLIGEETTQIGEETTLIGEETTQIGEETTLIGEETTLIGEETTLIGEETTLIGEETTQIGEETTQVGEETTQIGEETIQIGEETTQIGEETTQIGEETTLIGEETTLIGEETTLIGEETTQIEEETTQIGEETTQIGEETTQIGEETTQMGEETAQIGEETTLIGEETTENAEKTPDAEAIKSRPNIGLCEAIGVIGALIFLALLVVIAILLYKNLCCQCCKTSIHLKERFSGREDTIESVFPASTQTGLPPPQNLYSSNNTSPRYGALPPDSKSQPTVCNQNTSPPSENQYNFRKMKLRYGVLPNNRLAPLPNPVSTQPDSTASNQNEQNEQNLYKSNKMIDVFPNNRSNLAFSNSSGMFTRQMSFIPPPGALVIEVQPTQLSANEEINQC